MTFGRADAGEEVGPVEGQEQRNRVSQDGGAVTLNCYRDDRLPDDCVRVATANAATVQLGAAFGRLNVERLASTAEVER